MTQHDWEQMYYAKREELAAAKAAAYAFAHAWSVACVDPQDEEYDEVMSDLENKAGIVMRLCKPDGEK